MIDFDRNIDALVLIMATVGAILGPGVAAIANGGELDPVSLTASFCIGVVVGAGLGLMAGLVYNNKCNFWRKGNKVAPASDAEDQSSMKLEDV